MRSCAPLGASEDVLIRKIYKVLLDSTDFGQLPVDKACFILSSCGKVLSESGAINTTIDNDASKLTLKKDVCMLMDRIVEEQLAVGSFETASSPDLDVTEMDITDMLPRLKELSEPQSVALVGALKIKMANGTRKQAAARRSGQAAAAGAGSGGFFGRFFSFFRGDDTSKFLHTRSDIPTANGDDLANQNEDAQPEVKTRKLDGLSPAETRVIDGIYARMRGGQGIKDIRAASMAVGMIDELYSSAGAEAAKIAIGGDKGVRSDGLPNAFITAMRP